jgi:glycosyltransferase involved in cell wall biosynthesis
MSETHLPSETDAPLVSVILPTHNRARWVGRAAASVLAQTHRHLELIVVDDASDDDTPEALAALEGPVSVLSQPRAGAYAARNLGLRHAAGEFVAFVDSDDVWHPDRLELQLPLMRRAEVGLAFGDAVLVGDGGGGARTCFDITPPRRGRVVDHFAWGNFVPMSTVLVRRSCMEEVGGFPTTHDVSADYLTWFRMSARYEFDYVPTPVADYTVHDEGISSDLGRSLMARIELFRLELERTSDPGTRAVLQRLLFNLGLHLGLAAGRGQARSVATPWRVTRRACASARLRDLPRWATEFLVRQLHVRSRHVLAA